jgi:hypothetical protein
VGALLQHLQLPVFYSKVKQCCVKLLSTVMRPPRLKRKSTRSTKFANGGMQCRKVQLLPVHASHHHQTLICCIRQQGKLQYIWAGNSAKPVPDQAPSCEESLVVDMRLHVWKIVTKCNMNLPKGLLRDSNWCLATLKLEACGVPDLL